MRVTPRYDGPAVIAIDGPLDDQLVPVTRQRRRFLEMLAGLSDEQWRAATRCEQWNVQDVASHLVGVDAFWQLSITSGLAGEPTRVLDNFDPAATPATLIEPLRALPPAEVLAQLDASMDGFLDTLAFWKPTPKAAQPQYRIHVADAGSNLSQVQVQSQAGTPEASPTGKKILNLLYDQLK